MTTDNDLRDAMIEEMITAVSAVQIDPSSPYTQTILFELDHCHLTGAPPYDPTAEQIIRRACEAATDAILALLARWDAGMDTAAVNDFAKNVFAELDRKGFLHASDRAIPLEIIRAVGKEVE